MVFSILVTGAILVTYEQFRSHFLVEASSEDAALEAVTASVDWENAAYFQATPETEARPISGTKLTPGLPLLVSCETGAKLRA